MLEKKFIGVKELSNYLGVKVNTLYSWVFMKKIPYIKMGRLVKFDLNKIDAWVKENEVKPMKL